MRSRSHIVLCAAVLTVAFAAVGCRPETTGRDSMAVATVDGTEISAREFRLNYELGYPHLKTGSDPAASYLDRMIDEKLLAVDGRRRGLETNEYVRSRVENLTEQLMVEQVFRRYVNDRVEVTDAQIEEYHRREHVRFKLRFLPAPARETALRLSEAWANDGFESAVRLHNTLTEGAELSPAALETGYLSHDELEPEVLDAVVNAPVGQPVGPVRQRNAYLVIAVDDIRREPATRNPSPDEIERYRQILFQKESARLAGQFVGETMRPTGMKLRGSVYRDLEHALWAWISRPPDGDVQAAGTGAPRSLSERIRASAHPTADAVRALFDETVMTTTSGSWTVDRFLREYPAARYPLSNESFEAFRGDLYDAFGLTLRDKRFIRMAEEEDLLDSDSLRRVIRLWEDKWVYEAVIAEERASIELSDDEVEAYFLRHRDHWPRDVGLQDVAENVRERATSAKMSVRIDKKLKRLRSTAAIAVDRSVLDALDLSPPGAAPVSVVALHTGRPDVPVVDPSL